VAAGQELAQRMAAAPGAGEGADEPAMGRLVKRIELDEPGGRGRARTA
jgi:hypothetical protein